MADTADPGVGNIVAAGGAAAARLVVGVAGGTADRSAAAVA